MKKKFFFLAPENKMNLPIFRSKDPSVLLEDAFLYDKKVSCAAVPIELQKNPSAAPSAILSCLLSRLSMAQKASGSTSRVVSSQSDERRSVSETSSALLHSRAQRGLQKKDPLLKRFAKKNIASEASHPSTCPQETIAGGEAITHWTSRPFSAMSAAMWSVFRRDVGIEVELVRSRRAHTAENEWPPHVDSTVGPPSGSSLSRSALPYRLVAPIRCWGEAGLSYALGAVVAEMFSFPTSIQSQCVPVLLAPVDPQVDGKGDSGKFDLLAVGETGGGKTAAYLIPAIEDVLHRPKLLGNHELISLGPFVLVLVPTRELVEQVAREAEKIIQGKVLEKGKTVESLEEVQWSQYCTQQGGCSPLEKNNFAEMHNQLHELQVVKVIGGESEDAQHDLLSKGAHIVVGTVGQVLSLLEARLLSLGNTKMIVVDEVDRMIEENQKMYLDQILQQTSHTRRQMALFTATLTDACFQLASQYLSKECHYVVRAPYRCPTVFQSFEVVPSSIETPLADVEKEKEENEEGSSLPHPKKLSHHDMIHPEKLLLLIKWLLFAKPPIIVFANEKKMCDALQEALLSEAYRLQEFPEDTLRFFYGTEPPLGLSFSSQSSPSKEKNSLFLANLRSIVVVHSEYTQKERGRLMERFQRGERRILITTDLLARGLDVPGVNLVVNYDMPWVRGVSKRRTLSSPTASESSRVDDAIAQYIHRVGRTGRAGMRGVAVSFVCVPKKFLQEEAHASNEGLLHQVLSSESGRVDVEQEARYRSSSVLDDDNDSLSEEGEISSGDAKRYRHGEVKRTGSSSTRFWEEDITLLPGLWKFLVSIVESNGITAAERALLGNSFDRIHLPTPLATLLSKEGKGRSFDAITL